MVVGGGGVESNFSVIFGPNLETKTLLQPRPKLNNSLDNFTPARAD